MNMMQELYTLMPRELLLLLLLFILLIVKISGRGTNEGLLWFVQIYLLLTLAVSFFVHSEGSLFGTQYVQNGQIILQKNILISGLYLMSLLFADWFKKHGHLPEYLVLMISSVLGMLFLVSSRHMLMFYVSLELATIPLAALVNFDLRLRQSGEAAMKMILSSAFASGILLMGISLLYGITGSLQFDLIARSWTPDGLGILVFFFIFSAFAFKLSVVPFHFWTADVYEGAPMPVAAFLSVMSKAALAFAMMGWLYQTATQFSHISHYVLIGLALLTIIIGNLFAMRQESIKRFLAFSSIAQVGFILLAIAGFSASSAASVTYFIIVYLFSNLLAFAIAGLVCIHAQRVNLSDYKGFSAQNPLLAWGLALALFSLAGIPPTAGFFGKFFLLASGASQGDYFVVALAALNMVISLYYYLKLVKYMFTGSSENTVQIRSIHPTTYIGILLAVAAILVLGFMGWIYDYIRWVV